MSVCTCFKQKQQTGFNPDRDECGWFMYTREHMLQSQFEKPIPHRPAKKNKSPTETITEILMVYIKIPL